MIHVAIFRSATVGSLDVTGFAGGSARPRHQQGGGHMASSTVLEYLTDGQKGN